jgi:hypothetical protein
MRVIALPSIFLCTVECRPWRRNWQEQAAGIMRVHAPSGIGAPAIELIKRQRQTGLEEKAF